MNSETNIADLLRSRFGHEKFLPPQREIIESVLDGSDTVVLMPTGGGKSLCYQLPALVVDGLTLVVSPLISLMQDQVQALKAQGIAAAFVNSSLPYRESFRVQAEAKRGDLRVLYVAPERLAVPGFRNFLNATNVGLIAIDEAHCISEWGHDFRPDYRNLSALRSDLPSVPMMALTATATDRVRQDIVDELGLREPRVFVSSFNRPNLKYLVLPKRRAFDSLLDLLERHRGQPAIIYRFSRRNTEELASKLAASGYKAAPYHAGLESEVRRETQEKFTRGQVAIIVATIAFGMGIDKPDIRLIVHYELPKSIEGYFQETGRAGRDGQPSDCVLLFSRGDTRKHDYFIDEIEDETAKSNARKKLGEMVEYGDLRTCRRQYLLGYFGERLEEDNCGGCDVCLDSASTAEEYDATEIAQKVLSAVVRTGQRFGARHVAAVLRGSRSKRVLEFGHDRLSVHGIARRSSDDELAAIVDQLVDRGLLARQGDEYPTLAVTSAGLAFLSQRETLALTKPKQPEGAGRPGDRLGLEYDEVLFQRLRALRMQLATERGVSAYVIFPNETLQQMAAFLPLSEDGLSRIHGVGPNKLAEFGDAFLSVLRSYAQENGLEEKSIPFRRTSETRRRQPAGPTDLETKRLLDDGLSVRDIAQGRGLTETTITNHLERLVASGEHVELGHLVPPQDRRTAIARAIHDSAGDLLSPVRELLGDDYSYDEIRLVKIWLRQQSGPGA